MNRASGLRAPKFEGITYSVKEVGYAGSVWLRPQKAMIKFCCERLWVVGSFFMLPMQEDRLSSLFSCEALQNVDTSELKCLRCLCCLNLE